MGGYNLPMGRRTKVERWLREERLPTVEELEWLASREGREVCDAMASGDAAGTPAEIERWRARIAPWQVAAAWNQVSLRVTAARKFARAKMMLFDRIGLEQSSDEVIAAHKARRFQPFGDVADLCCGVGGDAIALAAGRRLIAADWSAPRTFMCAHNCSVYGRTIEIEVTDVDVQRPPAAAAHIDPDRRAEGIRRHDAAFASPGPGVLSRVIDQYRHVAVKLSPGADLRELPAAGEIELISHGGECRQAVLWTGSLQSASRRATVLPWGETIASDSGEPPAWPEPEEPLPGLYLLEPDAAVIRADLVGALAARHDLAPVDPRIAWLVGSEVPPTSMLTGFRILHTAPWSLSQARGWLAGHEIGRLEIKTRGFAATPEDVIRRLHLKGTRQAVLFLTRIRSRPMAILAEREGRAST